MTESPQSERAPNAAGKMLRLVWLVSAPVNWMLQLDPARMAVIVALVGAALASALWEFRVGSLFFLPRNVLTLDVNADIVSLRLATDWVWRSDDSIPVRLSPQQIDELTSVNAPGVPEGQPDGTASLVIQKGDVRLRSLTIPSGSELRLERLGPSGFGLLAQGGAITGKLHVMPGARMEVVSGDRTIVLQPDAPDSGPATVEFTRDSSSVGTRLAFDAGQLSLQQVGVDSVAFDDDLAIPGRLVLVSRIRGGRLVLSDVGDTVGLGAGVHLSLAGSRKQFVADLRASTEGMRLQLKGKAREVLIGPEGYQDNVAPRLLTYWEKYLKVFGGAVVSIAGALWGLRKLSS